MPQQQLREEEELQLAKQNSSEEEKNHKHPKCHPGKLEEHCFLSDQDNFTSIFQITHVLDLCWSLFLSGKDKLPPALSALAQEDYRALQPMLHLPGADNLKRVSDSLLLTYVMVLFPLCVLCHKISPSQ